MEDLTIDDIVGVYPCLTGDINDRIQLFLSTNVIFKEKCSGYFSIYQDILRGNCTESDEDFSKIGEEPYKNTVILGNIRDEIEQLEKEKNNLQKVVTENEGKLKSLNVKKSQLVKKENKLQEKRDCVQVCKLMTNTAFTYQGTDISGYSFCPMNKDIKRFDFNPENYTPKEITDALYDIVKELHLETVTANPLDIPLSV